MQREPIVIEKAGRRVLPSSPQNGDFFHLRMGSAIVGWATTPALANAKKTRLERAMAGGHP
ncbi:hypothetical protein [Pseudomonas sp.]|uniref:hypothetical protein n=1 Tax=Pseudomonas sp. TaxID=306 RepID=UPI003CC54DCC